MFVSMLPLEVVHGCNIKAMKLLLRSRSTELDQEDYSSIWESNWNEWSYWVLWCRLGVCYGCITQVLPARLEVLLAQHIEQVWLCDYVINCGTSLFLLFLPECASLVCNFHPPASCNNFALDLDYYRLQNAFIKVGMRTCWNRATIRIDFWVRN